MGAFDTIDIAATGADASQTWLDAIAHNLANVNTIRSTDEEPFRAMLVYAEESLDATGRGAGTHVRAIVRSDGDPMWVYDPEHPLADEEGYVVRAVVDVAGHFERGETVRIYAADTEIARGVVRYSIVELEAIKGLHSNQIRKKLGYDYGDEVVHHNDMVILQEM